MPKPAETTAALFANPGRHAASDAETIRVTGYHRGGYECGHCGRELLHCVATDRGVFGAACLSQTMTRPQKYMGRSYRLSTSAMISLARGARDPVRNGLSERALTFELVEG